jgi:hypothetical protein
LKRFKFRAGNTRRRWAEERIVAADPFIASIRFFGPFS